MLTRKGAAYQLDGWVRIAPSNVPVYNPAFDVTPAELVTAIITETGIVAPPYEQALAVMRWVGRYPRAVHRVGVSVTLIALAGTIVTFVAIVAIGVILRAAGLLHSEDARPFNTIIIYVGLPAFVFRAVHQASLSWSLLRVVGVAWAASR